MKKVKFVGGTRPDVRFTHGGLRPVPGVKTYQVLRCNRLHPVYADDYGWTYNHAPMLCRHYETYYVNYLSNPVSEHLPPGQTLFCHSSDGVHWSKPSVLFPQYPVAPGTVKRGHENEPFGENAFAVMHQRMGWYAAKNGRLLGCGYYGLSINHNAPNDGLGIGRVVREVYADHTLGPIYFIRYNQGYSEENTSFPFYTASSDPGFTEACGELLANPLAVLQWIEESDRGDPLLRINEPLRALCYYHTSETEVVGLWKWSRITYSHDNGQTWDSPSEFEPSLVMAGQKIWAQRTSDGRYAAVYTPTPCNQHRYPLAVIVSEDGYTFDHMRLVCGDVPPRRYIGLYKDYGTNYVRGIAEGNGEAHDGALWVTYSMGKEDLFVSRIPVPVLREADFPDHDDFARSDALDLWSLYCPVWAPVDIAQYNNAPALRLQDRDPVDYAKAERMFPPSSVVSVRLQAVPMQCNHGELFIELQDGKGLAHFRMMLASDGKVLIRSGAKWNPAGQYTPAQPLDIEITNDCVRFSNKMVVNGAAYDAEACASCFDVERIVFRTGDEHNINIKDCHEETPDIPACSNPVSNAVFYITKLTVVPVQS